MPSWEDRWCICRYICGVLHKRAGSDNFRFRCNRWSIAWEARRKIFSRILQRVLLFALIYFLRDHLLCARSRPSNMDAAEESTEELKRIADRTGTSKMRSNQIRLYFSSIAYMLLNAFRQSGIKGTQSGYHWLKSYPFRDIFIYVFKNIKKIPIFA